MPNVDRKLKKKLEKFPTKRLPVGVSEKAAETRILIKNCKKCKRYGREKKREALKDEK